MIATGYAISREKSLENALKLRLSSPVRPSNLAKIAAVDPAAAGRASNEMLGFVLRRIAEALP